MFHYHTFIELFRQKPLYIMSKYDLLCHHLLCE